MNDYPNLTSLQIYAPYLSSLQGFNRYAKQLKSLMMASFSLESADQLNECDNLEHLVIYCPKIKSTDFILKMSNLSYLDLSGCKELILPKEEQVGESLAKLDTLVLNSTYVTASDLNFLKKFPGLRVLEIGGCKKLNPVEFIGLLENTNVSTIKIDDKLIPHLKQLEQNGKIKKIMVPSCLDENQITTVNKFRKVRPDVEITIG